MDDFHCWYCSGVPQDTTGGTLLAGIDPASPSGFARVQYDMFTTYDQK